MARILLSSSNAFMGIARTLHLKGHQVWTVSRPFSQQLANADIPNIHLASVLHTKGVRMARNLAIPVLAGLHNPPADERIPANAIQNFREEGVGLSYKPMPELCALVLALDEVRPDLILLQNDIEDQMRVIAMWAASRSVPCVHIPHSVYQDINRTEPGTDIHDIVTASYVAVGGWYQRAWYESRGVPPDRIRETGLPQFDAWPPPIMDRARARRLLKVNAKTPVVSYAASWRQNSNLLGCNDEHKLSYLAFLSAVRRITGVEFIIKLHPRTPKAELNWHVEVARQSGTRCQVLTQHLDSCLYASDAVLVYGGSNVILEASYVPDIRLLTVRGFEDDPEVINLEPHPDSMIHGIVSSLHAQPPDLRALRAKYIGVPDGQAGARIIEWGEELINGQ